MGASSTVPRRLLASSPGWTVTADVCVIGSGVAGLCAALHAREAGLSVVVVTKVNIDDGSTRWAQGGIAAVLDPVDTPAAHAQDTLVAGVGLCDPAAVEVLTKEGPGRLHELIRVGAEFDRNSDGSLMLTREGGHHANRIVHAGGDATGAEVQRALHVAIHRESGRRDPGIRLIEHALVLDLLTGADGRAAGVSLHVLGEGSEDGVGAVLARAVVLATGGLGQVFASTTNPAVSTGDGVALALRAGAAVTDLEFVQFHPTALYLGANAPAGQQPLVSEAMRGEGAYLRNRAGERFMVGRHELAELAPRDIVAKNITREMLAEGSEHVWLDARHLGAGPGGKSFLEHRFPSILARARQAGIDPVTDLVPVAPAAHYASGGVRTDLSGRTSVPGLYACGEVACTGVHGANRLASNSLLEGLVFAGRIGQDLARDLPGQAEPVDVEGSGLEHFVVSSGVREDLQHAMVRGAGVLRSAESLAATQETLTQLGGKRSADPRPVNWEVTNLHTVATALVAAALTREETRGCHWREDFPNASGEWRGHLLAAIASNGALTETYEAMA